MVFKDILIHKVNQKLDTLIFLLTASALPALTYTGMPNLRVPRWEGSMATHSKGFTNPRICISSRQHVPAQHMWKQSLSRQSRPAKSSPNNSGRKAIPTNLNPRLVPNTQDIVIRFVKSMPRIYQFSFKLYFCAVRAMQKWSFDNGDARLSWSQPPPA